jgi:hypothetical protein
MDKIDWLTKTIREHKGQCNVIPIKNELLGFVGGDYTTAALLTQILYWQERTKITGGWIAKSYKDWTSELFLSEKKVRKSMKLLEDNKLIQIKLKKFNGSPTNHYRLQREEFYKRFIIYLKNDVSITTKGKTSNSQKGRIVLDQKVDLIMTKGQVLNSQKGRIESDQKANSITEPTAEFTIKPTTEKKTECVFSSHKSDFENFHKNSDVVPKEKSSAKKEKIAMPFVSKEFEQIWESWKAYRFEKYRKTYSIIEEQAALMPLQSYDESYSKQLITQAIANSWKNFHFENIPVKYQDFLTHKSKSNESNRGNHNKEQIIQEFKNDWSRFDHL